MRSNVTNEKAQEVLSLLTKVQTYFKTKLLNVSDSINSNTTFKEVEWLRDEGLHGGGMRFEALPNGIFNRASINVSQIHYENDNTKHYDSATALSTIIHPSLPFAPSIHIHISWTTHKDGQSYWRIMADLNPSIIDKDDKEYFDQTLKVAAKENYLSGRKLGNTYFDIPALQKRRGVSHFYLEGFNPTSADGSEFANQFVTKVIDTYVHILQSHLVSKKETTEKEHQLQLDYHTLYFYQVLTLDKGTTAGLLVHNQNDVGTLGSLPSHLNRDLLASWQAKTPAPLDQLVGKLLDVLPTTSVCTITPEVKAALAQAIRTFYQPKK